MLRPLLNASRYLVIAAVLGALASALALFAYGLVDTIVVIARTLTSGDVSTTGAKALMLYFIEIFDLFLLGTVMLIMALSLGRRTAAARPRHRGGARDRCVEPVSLDREGPAEILNAHALLQFNRRIHRTSRSNLLGADL